jgi:hypothetical protein
MDVQAQQYYHQHRKQAKHNEILSNVRKVEQ